MLKVLSSLIVIILSFSVCRTFAQTDSLEMLYDDITPVEVNEPKTVTLESIKVGRTHFLTYPGALDDPSRLLSKFSSISSTNDQANFILYRGLPSHYHRWKMYGARILNPNHLPSAGTISDLPNRSAGGVNALSGQILSGLEFYGNPSRQNLNSLGGSSNMQLRTPFEDRITTNLSVIGLELGLDRIQKDGSSLSANYRYSFVGLLNQLGVDFDGEKIGYQDLTLHYTKAFDDHKKLNLYAVLGADSNNKSPLDSSLVQRTKDTEQIDFTSSTFIAGANYMQHSEDIESNHAINFSHKSLGRTSERMILTSAPFQKLFESTETLLSSIHRLKFVGEKYNLELRLEPEYYEISSTYQFPNKSGITPDSTTTNQEINFYSVLPSVLVDFMMIKNLKLSATFGFNYNSASFSNFLVGGTGIEYQPMKELKFFYQYQRASQIYEPELLLYSNMNQSLSDNFELGFSYKNFSIKGFYHSIFFVPFIDRFPYLGVTNLDILPRDADSGFDNYRFFTGYSFKTQGIEFNYHQDILWADLIVNATLMSDPNSVRLPYQSNFNTNIILKKSIELSKNKQLGIALSLNARGSMEQPNINLDQSRDQGFTSYYDSFSINSPDTRRIDPYQRVDTRIYYKKIRKNGTYSTLSLDIQNVMNRENEAHYFYDPLTDDIQLQRQLGMIPVISWRASW